MKNIFLKVSKKFSRSIDNLSIKMPLYIRECPICKWKGSRFKTNWHKLKTRYDSTCPKCCSKERDRLIYVLLKDFIKSDWIVYHAAPEGSLTKWIQKSSKEYISGDIIPGYAMEIQDLRDLTFEDNKFDLIWASHVLEHIKEDNLALSEIYRVLKPNGYVVLQVPTWGENTIEEIPGMDKKDREKLFFQSDHVRLYGKNDFINLIKKHGFNTRVLSNENLSIEENLKYSLNYLTTNYVFIGQKKK